MLELKWVRNNFDQVKLNLLKRFAFFDAEKVRDQLLARGLSVPENPRSREFLIFLLEHHEAIEIDILKPLAEIESRRRHKIKEVETLKAERNTVSNEIARLKKEKKEAGPTIARMKEVGDRIKALDEEVARTEDEMNQILVQLPNLLDETVPLGASEEDNEIIKTWGHPPKFDFTPKDHVDVGVGLGVLDLDAGTQLSGSRFPVLKGNGARLERALAAFMLDVHTRDHHYLELGTPYLVNKESMYATGQIPDKEGQLYQCARDDLYLIPTGEVPFTNLFRDQILNKSDLPAHVCGWTPCFRRESGSYGKDVRGMLRVHQFHKVELVKIVHPHRSFDELEALTRDAEEILRRLGLPYRVMSLCSGDMGFCAAKTYDIEVWLPGQNRYREISSCSHFLTFQSNRGKIRYREDAGARPELVHTLNGSGVAIGRALIAILENYQRADGSVTIPPALVPYMGGIEILTGVR